MTQVRDDGCEQSLRRPWFRFSVRTLLVLITLLSVWLAIQANRARHQKTAVDEIIAAGGQVLYDYEPSRFEKARRLVEAAETGLPPPAFVKEPGGPKWLRQLIGNEYFQHVVEVDLRGAHWTDTESVLRHIASLSDLERLFLIRADMSDEELRHIGQLTKLKLLVIRDNEITDGALVHLYSLCRLEQLNVINTKVSAEGVANLQEYLPDCVVLLEE